MVSRWRYQREIGHVILESYNSDWIFSYKSGKKPHTDECFLEPWCCCYCLENSYIRREDWKPMPRDSQYSVIDSPIYFSLWFCNFMPFSNLKNPLRFFFIIKGRIWIWIQLSKCGEAHTMWCLSRRFTSQGEQDVKLLKAVFLSLTVLLI